MTPEQIEAMQTTLDSLARVPAMEAEIVSLAAENARLRHEIAEASDPDFLFGAMDNVNDMGVGLEQFAAAASRAIRAALDFNTRRDNCNLEPKP